MPAEIDHAVFDRLRRIRNFHVALGGLLDQIGHFRNLLRWREDQVDRLVDLVLDRIERHHAGLPDPRPDPPLDVEAAAAHRGDIERGTGGENFAQAADLGDGLAHRPCRPRCRDAVRSRGSAPRRRERARDRACRSCRSVCSWLLSAAPVCAGEGNFHDPPSNVVSSSAREVRQAPPRHRRPAAGPCRDARRSGCSCTSACASGSRPALSARS